MESTRIMEERSKRTQRARRRQGLAHIDQQQKEIDQRIQRIAQRVDEVAQRVSKVGLNVTIQRDPGKPYADLFPLTLNMALNEFYRIAATVERIEPDGVFELIEFVVGIDKEFKQRGVDDPADRRELVRDVLVGVAKELQPTRETKNRERIRSERALWAAYTAMQEQHYSYPQAALIASEILDEDVSADALRMRLNRWIKKRGLQPVTPAPGRPRETRTQ